MNPRIAVPLFTVFAFAIAMTLTGALLAPEDVWPNVLLSGMFLSGIGLGGGFLIAVHDVSNGRWLGPVRHIACSFTRLVLPGSVIVLVAILFGGSVLYPGFHEPLEGFKGLWLGRAFVTARAIAYLIAWVGIISMLRRRRGAALFIVVFGVTVWLASVDWVMALEPHFASTMFGVYHFAGLFAAAIAAVVIVAVHRSRTDAAITSDHIHDLGKMLFAFTTFWMYIWFCQGMLIWYGNLSEETPYYAVRAYGNWGVLFWVIVALMWVLPFLVLLPEGAKRNRTIVMRVAVGVLIGHWLDLYVSIAPAHAAEPRVTGWELALALGTFAAVGWAATRPAAVDVPVPVLAE